MKKFAFGLAALTAAAVATPAMSAVLFSDNMDSGAGWTMIQGPDTDSAATFGYDYSADGIPEAPNSVGGAATSGVKLEANFGDFIDVGAHFTLIPTGQNFTGAHQLQFDAWMNYDVDERINGGSAGTTEFLGGGLGHNGTSSDVNSGAQAIATGDGGSGSDWRAFKDGFFLPASAMTAGDRNGFNSYYSNFMTGSVPPAAQGQPAIAGTAGSPGFEWITWIFAADGAGNVDISILKPNGGKLIASIDCNDTSDGSSGCNTDGNISLFYADFFSSISPAPGLTFGVIDNVVVKDVPEPASLALLGLGGLAMLRRR